MAHLDCTTAHAILTATDQTIHDAHVPHTNTAADSLQKLKAAEARAAALSEDLRNAHVARDEECKLLSAAADTARSAAHKADSEYRRLYVACVCLCVCLGVYGCVCAYDRCAQGRQLAYTH